MRVGILGSGTVGRTLAGKIASLDHDVMLGTRDPAATLARTDTGPMTPQTFAQWHAANAEVKLGRFDEAAAHGELVVSATSAAAALAALEAAGAGNLAGKTLIDTSNPLDFSAGFPPSLSVCNTDSMGERIQAAFPDTRVVKALNTVNALVMVDPDAVGAGDHDILLCGNDTDAKEEVVTLLRSFGWRNVVDLGDIVGARGMEMYLPLWLRLMGAGGTPMFNVRIVR
ncbi:MAG: NADPH-dependent F420 reductase [Actinomycetota bacterium]